MIICGLSPLVVFYLLGDKDSKGTMRHRNRGAVSLVAGMQAGTENQEVCHRVKCTAETSYSSSRPLHDEWRSISRGTARRSTGANKDEAGKRRITRGYIFRIVFLSGNRRIYTGTHYWPTALIKLFISSGGVFRRSHFSIWGAHHLSSHRWFVPLLETDIQG